MALHPPLNGFRPTWVEVDLRALQSNFRAIRNFLPSEIKIIAVTKANGYGHGSVPVAEVLQNAGVDAMAVAILEEAVVLREAGISTPIILLNGFWEGQEESIVRHQLIPTVYDRQMLYRLEKTASSLQKTCRFHLKINTGMSRLGADWDESHEFFRSCATNLWAVCTGVCTHFSYAEDAQNPSTNRQLNRFKSFLDQIRPIPQSMWCHAANSAAMINFPESWFTAVRPGLALYGINPLRNANDTCSSEPNTKGWEDVLANLRPVLSFKSQITQIRTVTEGNTIGYGGSYVTRRESQIATLPVGYADGLTRMLSNKGEVLIRGQRAPIVGRISMDLTTIDVTEIRGVENGDEVLLIGQQAQEGIGAADMADRAHTIAYEILCRIGSRVPRIYCS